MRKKDSIRSAAQVLAACLLQLACITDMRQLAKAQVEANKNFTKFLSLGGKADDLIAPMLDLGFKNGHTPLNTPEKVKEHLFLIAKYMLEDVPALKKEGMSQEGLQALRELSLKLQELFRR